MVCVCVVYVVCVSPGSVPGGAGSRWQWNESCQYCLSPFLCQRTCGEHQRTGTGTVCVLPVTYILIATPVWIYHRYVVHEA